MAIGIITKIEKDALYIDGQRKNYKGKEIFNIGDKIEYIFKKGNIRNAKLFIEKNINIKEIKDIAPKDSNLKNIENTKLELNIDIIQLLNIDKIFKDSNKIDTFIKENIIFIKNKNIILSNAQLASFEKKLNLHNYNLNSNKIMEFVDERIKRDKAKDFYKSIKTELIENIAEVEAKFGISDLEQKYKNAFMKRLFTYMKKYYRYQIIVTKEGDNSEL
jgi:hypothetical protein